MVSWQVVRMEHQVYSGSTERAMTKLVADKAAVRRESCMVGLGELGIGLVSYSLRESVGTEKCVGQFVVAKPSCTPVDKRQTV